MSTIQTERQTFFKSQRSHTLSGTISAPGDKSISHRALIFGAMAHGTTQVRGLLEGEDVLATAEVMRQLGASVTRSKNGAWTIKGCGQQGFQQPKGPLDFGNSGTGARLIMGLIASHNLQAELIGDDSLSKRPMERVLNPLRDMGVETRPKEQERLPLTFQGTTELTPLTYTLPVASAQVKSAILLAGLNVMGRTTVIEPELTRDHTENMIEAFGGDIDITKDEAGRRCIHITGPSTLQACDIQVPGDPSSAAFPIMAALLTPGSEIVIENVLINPLRFGLYEALREMGANIEILNERNAAGETVADIKASSSKLNGVEVPAERAPSMIDEYPILAVAAACAAGPTVMHGLAELRVKESDRLDAMARGLEACGVQVEEGEDWLAVKGTAQVPGGANIACHMDHRIAMSFLTLGLISEKPIIVDGADMIATSFPHYRETMVSIGANIQVHRSFIIAVDGPAASGKGTLARQLAEKYDLAYLDTGSLYRAVASGILQQGLDPENVDDAITVAKSLDLSRINDDELRTAHVGAVASRVAALPGVRAAIRDYQRVFAALPPTGQAGAVLDGRDIGTVICPDADVKLFVDASAEIRAKRRFAELQERGAAEGINEASLLSDLIERDTRDRTRADSPLIAAENAHLLETSNLSIEAAFQAASVIVDGVLDAHHRSAP